jgi:uncharacterized protein (UPF0276 family)
MADVTNSTLRPEAGPIPAAAGIGLRFPHHRAVLEQRPAVPWFEVHTENYLGGVPLQTLLEVRDHYPLSLHGVGLSLGSAEGVRAAHLQRIDELARRVQPAFISEHLSWSIVGGSYLPDLLPLPMTEEALQIVCRNVAQVQDLLRRPLLIENPSSYLQYRHSTIPEWEFIGAVAARTGCSILCDVNNIYVSASNHGWDAERYLLALPPAAVAEIHLAGHAVRTLADGRTVRIDHHGAPVAEPVWALYELALQLFGAVPTLIEWDTDIPALPVLLAEAARAQGLLERCRMQRGMPSCHSQSERRHDRAA